MTYKLFELLMRKKFEIKIVVLKHEYTNVMKESLTFYNT